MPARLPPANIAQGVSHAPGARAAGGPRGRGYSWVPTAALRGEPASRTLGPERSITCPGRPLPCPTQSCYGHPCGNGILRDDAAQLLCPDSACDDATCCEPAPWTLQVRAALRQPGKGAEQRMRGRGGALQAAHPHPTSQPRPPPSPPSAPPSPPPHLPAISPPSPPISPPLPPDPDVCRLHLRVAGFCPESRQCGDHLHGAGRLRRRHVLRTRTLDVAGEGSVAPAGQGRRAAHAWPGGSAAGGSPTPHLPTPPTPIPALSPPIPPPPPPRHLPPISPHLPPPTPGPRRVPATPARRRVLSRKPPMWGSSARRRPAATTPRAANPHPGRCR
jgi:hypothetical protein